MLRLLVLTCLLCGVATQSIKFNFPQDGERIWVKPDDAVRVRAEIKGLGNQFGRLYGNGQDMGLKITEEEVEVAVAQLNDGIHTLEIRIFDANEERTGIENQIMFQKNTMAPLEPLAVDPKPEAQLGDGKTNWTDVNGVVADVRERLGSSLSESAAWNTAWAEYVAEHNAAMSGGAMDSPRMLIFRAVKGAGLGRTLEGLVSALVVAVLTKRVLLIDSDAVLTALQPPGIDWSYPSVHKRGGLSADAGDYRNVVAVSGSPTLASLLCDDLDMIWPQRIVVLTSDEYFVGALLHNVLYRTTLQQWFIDQPFRRIAVSAFIPSVSVAASVMKAYDNYYRGRHRRVVGVQLRTHALPDDPDYLRYDSFSRKDFPNAYWKCALLEVTSALEQDAAAKAQAIAIGEATGMDTSKMTWKHLQHSVLVLSDNNTMVSLARDTLKGADADVVGSPSDPSVGVEAALSDLLLLSLSDSLVITATSAFGRVASAWRGTVPYVVTFQSVCLKENTAQPCFEGWGTAMRGECYDKRSMVSPEVRFCGPHTAFQTMAEPVL